MTTEEILAELDDLDRTYGIDKVGVMMSYDSVGGNRITLVVTKQVEVVTVFSGETTEANRIFNFISEALLVRLNR